MDKVQEKFKEIDLQVLIKKKEIVLKELALSIDFTSKLQDLLDRINRQFLELTNSTYDSD
jgi:hypothetical protein